MADASFYRAFTERYRGSQETINLRLTAYLPFVLPLKQFDSVCQGVDLGCGRGEWLKLMRANGFEIQGIDLDQDMLEATREQGFNISHGDVIQKMRMLLSESQTLVSGFHLVEHLTFDQLQILIQESLRVLQPGGLLILETPNPENIVVGTANFYLDPTHQRPIPSLLLSFMVKHAGFEKVKVLRLNESTGLAAHEALSLLNVLNGVSPDYAVVAQKAGAPERISAIASAFETEYGLSLESLANSYDQQIKNKIQQADAKAQQAEIALIAIHDSSSWRLTAPLRMVGSAAKSIRNLTIVPKDFRAHAILYINRRLWLRRIALVILRPFPVFIRELNQALIDASSAQIAHVTELNLTQRGQRIYINLKAAIEKRDKGNR